MNNRRLRVVWSKREKDLVFHYPRKVDGHLAHVILNSPRQKEDNEGQIVFAPSFVQELQSRGYDISTLKFSVDLLPEAAPGTDRPEEA